MRLHPALVAALIATFAALPSSAPAAVLNIPVPAAGDITVAHVTFKGKPRGLRVANKRQLGAALTVVGGARRSLLSVVVVRRPEGAAGDDSVTLRSRGRVRKRRVVKGAISNRSRPSYCSVLPASFSHVKLLAGRALSGFSAADTAKFASFLGCRTFARQDEFLGAASSESGGGGTLPPPSNPCDRAPTREEQEACEERAEAEASRPATVRGSGTVSRTEDPRRFTYAVSFDQPVNAYVLSGVGYVYCPASVYAAWYDSCPAESTRPNGLRCESGPPVQDFQCGFPPGPDGEPPDTTIPAGQTMTGTYITDPEQPPPNVGSVGLYGVQGTKRGERAEIPVS